MATGTSGGPGRARAHPLDATQHLAVPFSSPADLSDLLAPQIRTAVVAGDPVLAVLADDTRAELRDALGADAAAVEFADPHEVYGLPDFTVALRWARASRRVTRPNGRALVISQRVDGIPACGPGYWARLDIGLDVATAGLPVTVVCPFAGNAPDAHQVRATHRVVATTQGVAPSPEYRPPHDAVADYPPPPPPDLGPPAAELAFRAEQLGEVRRVTAASARDAGLEPDHVADVVLAVNELATNSVEHGHGAGTLRIWTGDGFRAEVANGGGMHMPFPGMMLPPSDGARGRGLWLATELCDVLQVWSDDEQTVIRVHAR